MELARRIVVSSGQLAAEVSLANGRLNTLPLAELQRAGLPKAKATTRRQLKLDFSKFSPCDPREYATHFGLSVGTVPEGGHQTFEVQHRGTRYFVPALALMRALFRPASRFLSDMFSPNALERTCRLKHDTTETCLVVDASWAIPSLASRNSTWEIPLRWMMAHASARRMADSIHYHAMAGRIALDLPRGQVEIVLAGELASTALFVTEVRVLSVEPTDSPDFLVAGLGPQVEFLKRGKFKGRGKREPLSTVIPLLADGSFELTDEEWAIIGPVLAEKRGKKRRYEHCQRSLFDGVLGKLISGSSWKDGVYKVGDWRNAAFAYYTWTMRGTLTQALDALRSMR